MSDVNVAAIDALLQPLASGLQRDVFTMRHNNGLVVKVCNGPVSQNVNEYEVWASVQGTEYAKWFAPCRYLSDDGRVLIQERLSVIHDRTDPRLPKTAPKCLSDFKVQNWGVDSEGRARCLDYGMFLFATKRPWSLKKVKWWDAS